MIKNSRSILSHLFVSKINVTKLLTPIKSLQETYQGDKQKLTNGVIKSSAVVARNCTREHTDLPHSNEMLRKAKKNQMTVSELLRLHSWSCQVSELILNVFSIITRCLHVQYYLSTNSQYFFWLNENKYNFWLKTPSRIWHQIAEKNP